MKLTKNIDPTKVNFVCPKCQQIYYQADHDDFNENPKGVQVAARQYKVHYHSCKKRRTNNNKKR